MKNKKSHKRAADNGLKVCLATKEICPREEMLRFVVSPTKDLVFDAAERLPGCGLWVKADKEALQTALSKKLFNKAIHGFVKTKDGFVEIVERELKEYCLSLLGICRKAGLLVFGFENVKKSLSTAQAGVVFEATDAAQNSHNKLFHADDSFPVFSFLTRNELGQITNQDTQVYLLVLNSKLADKLKLTAKKIMLFTQTKG